MTSNQRTGPPSPIAAAPESGAESGVDPAESWPSVTQLSLSRVSEREWLCGNDDINPLPSSGWSAKKITFFLPLNFHLRKDWGNEEMWWRRSFSKNCASVPTITVKSSFNHQSGFYWDRLSWNFYVILARLSLSLFLFRIPPLLGWLVVFESVRFLIGFWFTKSLLMSVNAYRGKVDMSEICQSCVVLLWGGSLIVPAHFTTNIIYTLHTHANTQDTHFSSISLSTPQNYRELLLELRTFGNKISLSITSRSAVV